MLFVELALIRWTGSNVVYLSYFSNFVLLGSFLGIGIGFLRSRSRTPLFPWAAPALAFLVAFILAVPVEVDRTGAQLIFFGGRPTGLPVWVTLPIVFLAVAGIMAMIADGVARTFATFEPLEAYRLDIIGASSGSARSRRCRSSGRHRSHGRSWWGSASSCSGCPVRAGSCGCR